MKKHTITREEKTSRGNYKILSFLAICDTNGMWMIFTFICLYDKSDKLIICKQDILNIQAQMNRNTKDNICSQIVFVKVRLHSAMHKILGCFGFLISFSIPQIM